ncbi:hypothetical protein IQ288_34650 [Burkholderia sp. R-69980]|nr:hypothetical protein [Burkholderia sp. R-69980]
MLIVDVIVLLHNTQDSLEGLNRRISTILYAATPVSVLKNIRKAENDCWAEVFQDGTPIHSGCGDPTTFSCPLHDWIGRRYDAVDLVALGCIPRAIPICAPDRHFEIPPRTIFGVAVQNTCREYSPTLGPALMQKQFSAAPYFFHLWWGDGWLHTGVYVIGVIIGLFIFKDIFWSLILGLVIGSFFFSMIALLLYLLSALVGEVLGVIGWFNLLLGSACRS